MSDTPYLLRMEMIKLAQQRASEQFAANWEKSVTNAKIMEHPLNEVPEYPSTDLLLEDAEKLRKFVNGK